MGESEVAAKATVAEGRRLFPSALGEILRTDGHVGAAAKDDVDLLAQDEPAGGGLSYNGDQRNPLCRCSSPTG